MVYKIYIDCFIYEVTAECNTNAHPICDMNIIYNFKLCTIANMLVISGNE